MKGSDDQSLFAWQPLSKSNQGGFLAKSPREFQKSGNIVPLGRDFLSTQPFSVTNKGIHIRIAFMNTGAARNQFVGLLGCRREADSTVVAVKFTRALNIAEPLEANGRIERLAGSELNFFHWDDIEEQKLTYMWVYVAKDTSVQAANPLSETISNSFFVHIENREEWGKKPTFKLQDYYPKCKQNFPGHWFNVFLQDSTHLALRFANDRGHEVDIQLGFKKLSDSKLSLKAWWCRISSHETHRSLETNWYKRYAEHERDFGDSWNFTTSAGFTVNVRLSRERKLGLAYNLVRVTFEPPSDVGRRPRRHSQRDQAFQLARGDQRQRDQYLLGNAEAFQANQFLGYKIDDRPRRNSAVGFDEYDVEYALQSSQDKPSRVRPKSAVDFAEYDIEYAFQGGQEQFSKPRGFEDIPDGIPDFAAMPDLAIEFERLVFQDEEPPALPPRRRRDRDRDEAIPRRPRSAIDPGDHDWDFVEERRYRGDRLDPGFPARAAFRHIDADQDFYSD
jgi:hypothetical protein